MKLSIVVPCYNEAENIPFILKSFAEVIAPDDIKGSESGRRIEIILVDNGSTDESEKVLQALAPQYSFLKIVKVAVNQGYGFGILSGLRQAKGEYLGWLHGDLQTPPADALRAFKMIEERGNPENIFFKGLRKNRPLADQLFTFAMSLFEFFIFGLWLPDINAQPNIFHRRFFESWQNPPDDFALDLYAFYLAKKQKLPIVRFPVKFPKRLHGESTWNKNLASKIKFIKRTLIYSLKLKAE